MTDEEKKRVVRAQLDAFNRHNEEAFVEAIGTNYKSVDVPSGERRRGRREPANSFAGGTTRSRMAEPRSTTSW